MVKYIKKLLGLSESNKDNNTPKEVLDALDGFYNSEAVKNKKEVTEEVREPIRYGNPNADKIMLLVDDQETVFYLYDTDFEEIKERFNYDVLEEFKIIRCDGRDAGAVASKYIHHKDNSIVLGILDLTLGTVMKLPNGGSKLYDGVDLALELIELHPRCIIGVCTAHMITPTNPAISYLVDKFKVATGHNLLDYSFSKNSDRAKHIYDLIETIDNKAYLDVSA